MPKLSPYENILYRYYESDYPKEVVPRSIFGTDKLDMCSVTDYWRKFGVSRNTANLPSQRRASYWRRLCTAKDSVKRGV